MSDAGKAPEGYEPLIAAGLVYDDQVDDLAPSQAWQQLFAGGNNRNHFIRVDDAGEPHFIEQIDFVRYEANGPGYGVTCENAHDAFWAADAAIAGK